MKEFALLVVDSDTQVIRAFETAVPSSWRLISFAGYSPAFESGLHAAFVDLDPAAGPAGLDLIRRLKRRSPALEVMAMSGQNCRTLMEQSLQAGASRFLAKPLNTDELVLTLEKIEAYLRLQAGAGGTLAWVGSSAVSDRIRKEIASFRGEKGPILIEGESGTGKEVAARLIHSQDAHGELIPVNVASIPEPLFESEFFGHLRGSFTGAEQNKMGLSEAASGGDLFLDEIEALSLGHQSKLLRFLETGEVRRVGAKTSTVVRTRVIVATNRGLLEMVRDGSFRDDLYWRLRGKVLLLPPLRDRLEDVPSLARHFVSDDRARKKFLDDDALAVLMDYSWPGNVRELKRVCEQLVLISPLPIIRRDDVLSVLRPELPVPSMPSTCIDWSRGLPQLVHDNEGMLIRRALEAHRDIDDTAKVLQISRSSLYKKIRDHRIHWKGN